MNIETLYRLQIDVKEDYGNVLDDDWQEKIQEKSFQISRQFEYMSWQTYQGPIYHFGIRLESDNKKDLEKAGKAIVAYIKRFKGLEPL